LQTPNKIYIFSQSLNYISYFADHFCWIRIWEVRIVKQPRQNGEIQNLRFIKSNYYLRFIKSEQSVKMKCIQ